MLNMLEQTLSIQKRYAIPEDAMRCSTCMLSDICLPFGMSSNDRAKLDDLVQERVRVAKGQALFQLEDEVNAIYALRSGCIKTQLEDAGGQVQITGFMLPGELIGMDGLLHNKHVSNAIALEDSELCIMRLEDLDRISSQLPQLQQQLRRLMSKEINRSHHLIMNLGTLRSEQKLAAFLVNLSQRLGVLGYSPYEFVLRMSREEIGNFLGLTLETISRLFSRFSREGLLRIQQRNVLLLDLNALQELAGTDCA